MEKKYKRIPFDINLSKKIQSGEVEGTIVTQYNEPVRIVCFDKKSTNKRETYQVVALVETNGCECLIICGENGLCWDCENDCNRSLHIELPEEAPKHDFKIGDRVRIHAKVNPENTMYDGEVGVVVDVLSNVLHVRVGALPFPYLKEECEFVESAKLKYEFKPFDKVLVRDAYCEVWRPDIFSFTEGSLYSCLRSDWHYCIPYEGNEHLIGTTNNPE